MVKILDGSALSKEIRGEVADGVRYIKTHRYITPGLAAVLIGDDPASAIYVRNKGRACDEVGMLHETFLLPADVTQDTVLNLVKSLNEDDRFHGILIQLPLPAQLDEQAVIREMIPSKDVDGIHPFNLGKLVQGSPSFVPCTPAGIQELLLRNGYDPSGRHMVICGRSNIVGKPLASLMIQRNPGSNATVTICHTSTKDLSVLTRQADILVAAVGRAGFITGDMVSKDVIVIDVGINRTEDPTYRGGYRLEGDCDFESVSRKAEAITPVPGGVGPMTIAMLLVNTLKAAGQTTG
ncbi:bifunctional methylenetetrahydrofolate dehydrogenase/methenyltetrahydrofolate cyclohydrolase FolD [Dehalococcoidia bacterium]|nr:bifunctional methylenetetrahydrofolate dehydrogenase/methenyltetrahydrofolate cyclohydrolase FolD [Dehalococcoidia bacterium]